MASVIQGTGAQSVGSVASLSKAFASNVTAGSLLTIGCITNGAAMPTNGVSDTLSNAYTRRVIGTGNYASLFDAVAGSSGACTVTMDCTGSDFQSIDILEVAPGSGNAWDATAANRIDGTAVSGTGSTTPATLGSITTTGTGIVRGVLTHTEGLTTITANTGYSNNYVNTDVTNMPIGGIYQVTVSSGGYAPSWTLGAGRAWKAAGVAYKTTASGGGGGTAVPVFLHHMITQGMA